MDESAFPIAEHTFPIGRALMQGEFAMETIGVIGLGKMGKPIAHHMLNAGYRVVVHNRSQGAVEELVAAGAAKASTPREVASRCNAVITSLPDAPTVEAVCLGMNGIREGATQG